MKTVIWDYNGTVIDDVALGLAVENKMLEERGMKHGYTVEEYRNLFCFPIPDYYKKLGYDFEEEPFDSISDEYNMLYDAGFYSCSLVDGVLDKIKESLEKGYQNVILSACQDTKLHLQTESLGISQYFTDMMGIEDDQGGSKIEMAKKWMETADVEPEECIYVGDTLHDKDTAKAIGIRKCVLVSCGHQSYEVLRKEYGHVVHTMKEIIL